MTDEKPLSKPTGKFQHQIDEMWNLFVNVSKGTNFSMKALSHHGLIRVHPDKKTTFEISTPGIDQILRIMMKAMLEYGMIKIDDAKKEWQVVLMKDNPLFNLGKITAAPVVELNTALKDLNSTIKEFGQITNPSPEPKKD